MKHLTFAEPEAQIAISSLYLTGGGISMSAVDLWWSILSAFLALNFNADTQIHFPFLSSISNEGSTHHDK